MINQRLKSILTRQTLFTIAYYLVFSIVLFVIIFRVYQPELLNFRLQPFFAYDNAYYDYFSNMHFGNLRLISQFILQYMAYPVAGTLLLMVLLVGLSLSLFFLLGLKKYHYLRGIEFIPAILILSSLKSYTVGIELLAMALLAVLPALIGQLIPKRFLIPRIVYYLAVMLGLFIIFDLFTASLFAVVCSLTEIRVSGSIWRFAMPVLALISIWILKIIYPEAWVS